MANEECAKRLIYLEDAIALLEKDIAENKDALKTAYHGDKDVIRAEINGVRAAIHILKHHASHSGTVEVVHSKWLRHWNNYICDACREYQFQKQLLPQLRCRYARKENG